MSVVLVEVVVVLLVLVLVVVAAVVNGQRRRWIARFVGTPTDAAVRSRPVESSDGAFRPRRDRRRFSSSVARVLDDTAPFNGSLVKHGT